MSEPQWTCALWFWRYGGIDFELFDSERAAASRANTMEEYGSGSAAGIQYDDGNFVRREDWQALKELASEWERVGPNPNRPVTQVTVTPPFDAEGLTALADEPVPAWLGNNRPRR